MTRYPSIKDVAERSNTSISTVSNVLNNTRVVSEALRARVLQAAEELGYTANPIARSLKNRKSFSIGVIITDINCIFFAPVLKGIQRVLAAAGYSMSIFDSNYDLAREQQYIRNLKMSWADGIILAGVSDHLSDDILENMTGKTDGRPLPIISMENDLHAYGIDSVLIDNEKSSNTATSHLLETGCKRIAFLSGPSSVGHANKRQQGYLSALRQAGIRPDDALIVKGDFSPISGYNVVRGLLQARIPFDGIFAANDQMAVGALRALSNAGLRVPDDVRVVGFDNAFIASIVNPALTSINVPNFDMGVQAAQLLLDRIADPDRTPSTILLDYELIIRRSTMASAQTSWDMVYW